MPKLLQGNAKLTPIRGVHSVASSVPVIIDTNRKQVRGVFHCTHEGCEKKFPTRGRLRQHEFVHLPSNKRVKYACKLGCHLTFSNSSSRSRHHKRYCPHRPKQDTNKEKAEQEDLAVNQNNVEMNKDDINGRQLEEKDDEKAVDNDDEEEEYDGGGWDGDDGRFATLQNQPLYGDGGVAEQYIPPIHNAFIPHSALQIDNSSSSAFLCNKCKSASLPMDMLAYCKQCEKEFCKPCFDIHATGHTLIIGRPLQNRTGTVENDNAISSQKSNQDNTNKGTHLNPKVIEDLEDVEDTDVGIWFDKHLSKQTHNPTLLQEYTERIDTGAAIRIERRLKHQEDLLRGDPAALRRETQRKKWQFLPPSLSINVDHESTSVIPLVSSSPPISFASPPSPDALIDTGYVCNPKEAIQALAGNR